MRKTSFIFLAAAFVFSGCLALSLQPIYTDKDLVFDSKLLGTWAAKGDKKDPTTWTFATGTTNSYKLTITDGHWAHLFDAHLVKLGTNLFLDIVISKEGQEEISDDFSIYPAFLVAGHGIAKVVQSDSNLKLAWLGEEFEKLLEKEPSAVRHQKLENKRIVLTGSTKDLQDFLLKYGGSKEVFMKEAPEMIRLISGSPQNKAQPTAAGKKNEQQRREDAK
jgi:hypothetical protein